jgi:hypothetical protein
MCLINPTPRNSIDMRWSFYEGSPDECRRLVT